MINITDETILNGIEKTGCSVGHIQQCLRDSRMHGNVRYSYYGKKVLKGTIDLYTKNGTFTAEFKCIHFNCEQLDFVKKHE